MRIRTREGPFPEFHDKGPSGPTISPEEAHKEALAVMRACGENLIALERFMSDSLVRSRFRRIPALGGA